MNISLSDTKPPQGQKISITKDIAISYYHYFGKKDLILLLIHGLGGSKEDFISIFEYPDLTTYNILFPDLVGHGDSSKPSNYSYSMADQANILYQLLEALCIKSNILLIAHSMGGPIAISLAELLGNRVVGMIYAEGNIDEDDCFFSKTIIDSFSSEDWKDRGFNQFLLEFQNNPEMTAYATNFAKAGPVTIYRSSRDLYKVSKEDTLLTRLVQLSIPILGIYGAKNKGKFSSEIKLLSKYPIRFIPDAGHDMIRDNPEFFYQILIDYLKQF